VIRPIAFERRTLRFDLPAMTGATLALWLLARDGSLSRVDGILLFAGGAAYTVGIIRTSRRESAPVRADYASHTERTAARGGRGLPLRVIAADLLVLAVVALITVPVLLTGHRVSRVEGGAFVAAYLGYLVWLTLV
jgi:cation:H+ antiporter